MKPTSQAFVHIAAYFSFSCFQGCFTTFACLQSPACFCQSLCSSPGTAAVLSPLGNSEGSYSFAAPALWAAWSKCRAQQAKAFMASSASPCPEEKGDAQKMTGPEVSFLPCTFFDAVGEQALSFKDERQGPPLSAFLPLVHQLFLCDMSFPNSVKIKVDTALITGF